MMVMMNQILYFRSFLSPNCCIYINFVRNHLFLQIFINCAFEDKILTYSETIRSNEKLV